MGVVKVAFGDRHEDTNGDDPDERNTLRMPFHCPRAAI